MRQIPLFSRYILLFAVLAFFSVGFLGLGHINMTVGSNGEMSDGNCFMPGMTEALCPMDPLEHIATWQSMFTAIPSGSTILLLLASLFALVLGTLFLIHRAVAPPQVETPSVQKLFAYYRQRIPIMHPLQEAFANGILHPKLFKRTFRLLAYFLC